MAFIETRFPVNVSYGSEGGPEFNTTVVPLDSGAEQRLPRWPVGRHKYDAAGGVIKRSDYKLVLDCFQAVQGRAHGFRWKDFNDYKTAVTITLTDCELVDAAGAADVGDGSTTVFYLATKYVFGSTTVYRPITKPVAATVVIGIDSVLQTLTTDYTLDSTTGAVTFTTAPALNEVLTCGCEFDVPVRFNTDYLPMNLVTRSDRELVLDVDIPVWEIRP